MTTQLRSTFEQEESLPGNAGDFALEWLLRNERWQAVMIPALPLPLPQQAVRALSNMLIELETLLTEAPAVGGETLLRFSQLHVGGCAQRMSARASVWQPRLGLGVFPDQPPPELWSAKDFEVMPGPEMKIRPMMNTVLRVASAKPVQEEVAADCLVSGGVLRFYSLDFEGFLRKSKEYLLPRLHGSAFQGHRFYLPLLNGASFRGAADEELDGWLPGIHAYLAQSPDEGGFIFALRSDLPRLLHRLNRTLERGREAKQLA